MAFPLVSRHIQLGQTCHRYLRCIQIVSQLHNMSRGALIVFEGCDRSGKTTQCKKIVESLNEEGIPAQLCRFPDRETAIGKLINDYLEQKVELEDHAVHLLFAANRWEAVPKMRELLSAGKTLIVDRYSFSGVAFTAAKPGLDLAWCRHPEIGLPCPDAVIFMDLSQEVAASRAAFGGERYERTDFQKQVAENYQRLKDPNWKVVDASKSIEDLHLEVKTLVKDIIEETKTKELKQLWVKEESAQTTSPAKRLRVVEGNHLAAATQIDMSNSCER